ncbi:MAG TPA: hypothetical protein VFV75_08035 [Candidatus Polarisedimenticolaceae bacterium]|nr:hypothetical protein [Candidatus Polarisedimenticolaceae bacterium]
MTGSLTLLGMLARRTEPVVAPFPIPPDAGQVSSRSVEGTEEWRFTLRRPYPAEDVLAQYARHAAGLGWTVCAAPPAWEAWFESDLRRTQFMRARLWEIPSRREAVLLFLRYLEPAQDLLDAPRSETLHVQVLLVPVSQPLERLAQLT